MIDGFGDPIEKETGPNPAGKEHWKPRKIIFQHQQTKSIEKQVTNQIFHRV